MAIEDFKIEHFKTEHPDREFPHFDSVPEPQRAYLKGELAQRLGLQRETNPLEVVKRIHESFEVPSTFDATETTFDLRSVVKGLNLKIGGTIYINWDRFDHIDKMEFSDLADWFPYIWYPASDDVEIFDDTLQWVLVIRHDGAVALVPLFRSLV